MPDRRTLERLIAQAVLAPSSHNTQPWIFEVAGETIRLHADRTRALPVNDPEDRELVISCGCALTNLRAAAAAEGIGTVVIPVPDRQDADLLAEIRFSGPADVALADLSDAIAARRTYRKRFSDLAVTETIIDALRAEAEVEGAWVAVLGSEDARAEIARLVAEGDAAQWDDPRWRRELAQWMHPRRAGDGLSLPWLAVPVAQLVVRSFDMGDGVMAKDRELAEHSPLLLMLGTPGDGEIDRLAAGQALERVLLAATRAGLQASYLNQPIQVTRMRAALAELCEHDGAPQILLRLGYPEEALPATPRRPLTAVIEP